MNGENPAGINPATDAEQHAPEHLASLAELVTVAEAARCLGIGRSTLYRLLAEGRLPVQQFSIGREVRLPRRQLEAWLEGRLDHDGQAVSTYAEVRRLLRSRAS